MKIDNSAAFIANPKTDELAFGSCFVYQDNIFMRVKPKVSVLNMDVPATYIMAVNMSDGVVWPIHVNERVEPVETTCVVKPAESKFRKEVKYPKEDEPV
jgi:hypothetical protein